MINSVYQLNMTIQHVTKCSVFLCLQQIKQVKLYTEQQGEKI